MKKAKRKPMPSVTRQKEAEIIKERVEMMYNTISSLIMLRLKDLMK